ncbi:hypothetical protein VTO42DRAFT_8443 [Malbranchea cinnamomea]
MDTFTSASRLGSQVVRLPEPLGTAYGVTLSPDQKQYRFQILVHGSGATSVYEDEFFFSSLTLEDPSKVPPESNNSAWARARRNPVIRATCGLDVTQTIERLWILAYAVFSLRPELELFRLVLKSENEQKLLPVLLETGLAIPHPAPSAPPGQPVPLCENYKQELVVYRASFWQGAGSPFGPRPVWLGSSSELLRRPYYYPLQPLEYTLTTRFPDARVHARHPIRPPKPEPGSLIYSRYIPHLNETFSMIAFDWTNEEHVKYFHEWQNSPRVAAGWNETGTLEQHREYLRKIHEDPHQFAVLGRFDGTPFAYFEIYWAKEDHIGAYYDAQDYDRGRHFLVGDERYRGPHRVKAWHTSLTHYMFLDDPRTNFVVGEPRATGVKVLSYDQANGYHVEKFIDLPHKRAALVKCSREKFFQLVPFDYEDGKGA